jgi:hypothetical protein
MTPATGNSLRCARIMDHVELGAAFLTEPFDGQVLEATARACDRIQSVRLFFGMCDQLGRRIYAEFGRSEKSVVLLGDETSGNEFVDVKRQSFVDLRKHHEHRAARHEQRIAIWLRGGEGA